LFQEFRVEAISDFRLLQPHIASVFLPKSGGLIVIILSSCAEFGKGGIEVLILRTPMIIGNYLVHISSVCIDKRLRHRHKRGLPRTRKKEIEIHIHICNGGACSERYSGHIPGVADKGSVELVNFSVCVQVLILYVARPVLAAQRALIGASLHIVLILK